MKKIEWHHLYHYKYVLALLVFAVMVGFVGESSLINRVAQKREINALRNQITEQQEEFSKQQEELSSIKSNLSTVTRIAREKYYMKTQNEDVFVIKDEE